MFHRLSSFTTVAVTALLIQSICAQVKNPNVPTPSVAPLTSQTSATNKPAITNGTAVYQVLFKAQVQGRPRNEC
jgi:hypothetical protein